MNQDNQDLANIVYTAGMLLQAYIKVEGMKAENEQRKISGHSPAYRQSHFDELIDEMGVHHNALITNLHPRT